MKKRSRQILLSVILLAFSAIMTASFAVEEKRKSPVDAEEVHIEPAAEEPKEKVPDSILALEGNMPAQFYADVAKSYNKYGKYDRAIEFYKYAIQKAGAGLDISELYHGLGVAYRYKGKYAEAVPYLEKSVELSKDAGSKTNYAYDLASAYKSNKQLDKAIEAYQLVVNSAESNVYIESARRQLLYIYRQQNLLEEYIVKYEEQIKKDPKDINTYLNLAEIYGSVKYDPAKAVPYFEKALELKPDNTKVRDRLAQMYQNARQNEKALELYIKMAEEAPDDRKAYAYERVSNIYAQLDRKEEAMEWAYKILVLQKNDTYSLTRVASIFSRYEEYDKAIEMYTKALATTMEPYQKDSTLYQLAQLYERMREYDKAVKAYKEILSNEYKGHYDTGATRRIEQLKELIDNEKEEKEDGGEEVKSDIPIKFTL